MPESETLGIARWLVHERGLSVIALDHPDAPIGTDPTQAGKVPVASWKLFQAAHPTDANLETWFGNGRPRNLGIVTGAISGVVAIDCDSPAAEAWADAHLPASQMMTRTAKGSHRFYRHPGTLVANKARIFGRDGLALDVRADGGYVVAPGSVHHSRVVYARVGAWPPVAELPVFDLAWLASGEPAAEQDSGSTPRHTNTVPSSQGRDRLLVRARAYLASVPGAVEGQAGDQHTFVVACRLVRDFGLDRADALTLLSEWNATCRPPWSDAELEMKLDGALRYGSGAFGSKVDEDRPGWRGTAAESPASDADSASEAAPEPAADHGRPVIDATDQDLPRITAAAVAALAASNHPPTLFTFGGIVGRLDVDGGAVPVFVKLDEHRCRRALALAASWQRRLRNGSPAAAFPPVPVVRNVLASPVADLGLPVLHRIIEAPMFDRTGQLHLTPGYSSSSLMFYAPAPGLVVPEVAAMPANADVTRARELLLGDLLVDFPFISNAERAHALSVVLLPFVREMIDGPTPLYLVEKPTPGTGATLLVTALLWPAAGRDVPVMTEGTDEESWRKRITSTLCGSPTAVLIDNLRRRLDSAALSSAITATTWEDRVLGRSENIRIPVRCAWLATGNNPALSNEISRRAIRIRLDARIDRPWLRSGFTHDPLLTWAREHRPRLVWACLTLIQRWIADGRRPGRVVLGQFEGWSRVLGGVLDVAGVPGFLQNVDEFYDLADTESAGWRGLVERWADRHGAAAVGVADLWRLVSPDDGSGLEPLVFDFLDDAKATDRSLRTRFGKRLAAQRDRVFGGFRITAAEPKQGAARWRLVPTG